MNYEKEQKWLEELASEILVDPDFDDESDSDEEDNLEKRNEDSESEQELEVEPDLESRTPEIDLDTAGPSMDNTPETTSKNTLKQFFEKEDRNLYYIGKDKQTKWRKHAPPTALRSKVRAKNIITQLPGVKSCSKNLTDPVEIWRRFFHTSVIDTIVLYTNQHIDKFAREKYYRETYSKPTDNVEIEALIGLLYLCAAKKCNRLCCEEIFSTDGSSAELFRLTMSMQRFLFLLRHLRFDDYDTRATRKAADKLAPIRQLFEEIVSKFKDHFSLSQFTTVDEMLVAFRGKCPFRQYIPSKPAKYGVKIFALTDAKMFYTINMEVYVGKQPEGSPFQVSNSPIDVVNRIVQPISGTRRNVTTDNWFTSVELCQRLLDEHKLTILGTIRKNKRQIPVQFVVGQDRPVPSTMFAFRENCLLVSHVPKPKKNVLLISSMHDNDEVDIATQKPMMILEYNQTKIGVDMVDQLSSNYNVARNTRRWPMTVFYALLNTSGINSYVIYNCNQQQAEKRIPRRIFLTGLARGLTRNQQIRRHSDKHIPRPIRTRIQEIWNLPTEQPGTANPDEPLRPGRCTVCTSKQNRKTKYFCKLCNKYLCLEHCNVVCNNCLDDKL